MFLYIRFIFNLVFVNPFVSLSLLMRLYKVQKGGKVWVVGNGPTLSAFDPGQIEQNDIVIVCNYFLHHPIAKKFKVDFYCMSDPRLFSDHSYIERVGELGPSSIVIPLRQAFKLNWFRFRKKIIVYNYASYFKLWKDRLVFFKNQSVFMPLQCGDTVAFDIMVPLALSLKPSEIKFVGIDLKHTDRVEHSYCESLTPGDRSSDEYLMGEWQDNTEASLKVLMKNSRLPDLLK